MSKYLNDEFVKENLMGPNCVTMLNEIIRELPLDGAERILDLGCGKGLTSVCLAERFPAAVFAMDLWIPASENYARFRKLGLDGKIIPIHADALCPPFANGYFDAVISVDSYHYFGRDEQYLDTHLAPLIKKGGVLAIGIPGLIRELDSLPEEMAKSWTEEDIETIHSCGWWKELLSHSRMIDIVSVSEMDCYEESWNDWLACDHEYAVSDRAAMQAGAGKYMNLISIIGRRV